MQKLFFLFLLFLCAFLTNSTAQIKKTTDTPETFKVLKINNPELKKYFLDNSLFPTAWGNGFNQGEQLHAMRDLKDIVKISPMAMAEYRAYKDMKTASSVLTVASLACLVGALASFSKVVNGGSGSNVRPAVILYTGSLVCSIVSIPVSIGARSHFNRTLRSYNADLIGSFKNE